MNTFYEIWENGQRLCELNFDLRAPQIGENIWFNAKAFNIKGVSHFFSNTGIETRVRLYVSEVK